MKYLTESLDHWQGEASRLAAENESLRSELEATANLAIKQGEWLQRIVNIIKGEPGELAQHSTHNVIESVESLRVERDEALARAELLEDTMMDVSSAKTTKEACTIASDVVDELPAISLARVKGQAVTDALEYATGQVGSDDSAESLVDAICEHLENLSDGKFPTVGSTGNTWRSIKAQGAREALQAVRYNQGFSDTVVRVDELQKVIADMEKQV